MVMGPTPFTENKGDNRETPWKRAGSSGRPRKRSSKGPEARASDEITPPGDDVWYGRNWPGSDGSAATRTRQGAGVHCEAGARARRRANDALREWSEGAMDGFPPPSSAEGEPGKPPRRCLPDRP